MSLRASERRALARIERVLHACDPHLRSLFATFTSVTAREAMPESEQLRRRGWRAGLVTAAPLTVLLIAAIIAVGALGVASRACGLGRAAVTAASQPVAVSGSGWGHACPSRMASWAVPAPRGHPR